MGAGFPFGVMKKSGTQTVMMVPRHCEFSDCHCMVHFKMITGTFYENFASIKKPTTWQHLPCEIHVRRK